MEAGYFDIAELRKIFLDLGTYKLSKLCKPMFTYGNDLATTIFQYPAFTEVRGKKSHSFNTTTASGVGRQSKRPLLSG